MKKFLVMAGFAALLVACGGNNDKKAAGDDTSATTANSGAAAGSGDLSSNPDYQKGLELIAKNDCLTCHKVDEKVVGPAYADVAAKYENTPANVTLLAEKVVKGGQGVWGSVPMTAHPQLSQADAEQMVKYVLLLKKK
ncbi:c-type cytochrome [Deminuibacter soli]|uniref:Cytochrome c class I n=1 Tax=Deminuibacter soli TaxID=2291815 RepID=A0A3E1NR47_9BACT|nr:c-type cytochrome [Deminuibacter soli]RFM30416.1 cytochrome c class I [Deminuibacter soli]